MSDTSKASASEAAAKVFIARQDTLESVKSTAESVKNTTENVKSTAESIKSTAEGTQTAVGEVKTAVKTAQMSMDGEILPALWIAGYRLHGTNSYVFQDADVLARMYKSTAAVNDPQINGEALEYVLTHPEKASLSDWLKRLSDTRANGQTLFSGVETAAQLAAKASAMTAVAGSSTAMAAISRSKTAMTAIANSSSAFAKITASKIARDAVANSNAALWAVLNSTAAAGTAETSDLWMESLAGSRLATQFNASANSGNNFDHFAPGYLIFAEVPGTADKTLSLLDVVTGSTKNVSITITAGGGNQAVRRFFKTRATMYNLPNYSRVRYIPIREEA